MYTCTLACMPHKVLAWAIVLLYESVDAGTSDIICIVDHGFELACMLEYHIAMCRCSSSVVWCLDGLEDSADEVLYFFISIPFRVAATHWCRHHYASLGGPVSV